MKSQLNKKIIERFSRQIILKDIGVIGQKKILSSKVLIVGAGGLGSPVAEFLSRAGVGSLGIIDNYEYIVDGSDNFTTKLLLNDFCLKFKKNLIIGAISKFDGHILTFDFKNKKIPCLRCFFQENEIFDDLLNCESEGILGTVAGIVGTIQANEILKKILNIGESLDGYIFILDLLNLKFRKVKIKKRKICLCNQ